MQDFQHLKLVIKATHFISLLNFFTLMVHMGRRQLKSPLQTTEMSKRVLCALVSLL